MVRISTSQFWVELAVPVTHLYSYISKIKAVTEISNYYMSTRGMRFFSPLSHKHSVDAFLPAAPAPHRLTQSRAA